MQARAGNTRAPMREQTIFMTVVPKSRSRVKHESFSPNGCVPSRIIFDIRKLFQLRYSHGTIFLPDTSSFLCSNFHSTRSWERLFYTTASTVSATSIERDISRDAARYVRSKFYGCNIGYAQILFTRNRAREKRNARRHYRREKRNDITCCCWDLRRRDETALYIHPPRKT